MKPKLYAACIFLTLLFIFSIATVFSQSCSSVTLVGGTTTASNTSVCAGFYSLISVTGSTTGSGLNYQWETSSDSTNWTVVAGATSATLSTNQTNRYYRRNSICNNGASAYSSGIKINIRSFLTCYCTPFGYCSATYNIMNVSYANVSNSSTCSATSNYTNYSGSVAVADAMQGTYMPISVKVGAGFSSRTVECYVDANHNGAFETNEMSVLSSLSGNVYSGFVKIPFHAQTGVTMMRIIYSSAAYTYICSPAYQYSETEDYYLNITPNPTTTANGFVIYVKPTATGSDNSGRDWANAMTSLVRAIQTAANGDTVKVAKGTYYTGTGYSDGFVLHDSIAVSGGYPATGSPTDADRNVAGNPTILSGYVAAGVTTTPNYHVLYASGNMPACQVDGLILENGGYYSSNAAQSRGGGFSAENGANPTIKNCVIRTNNINCYGTAIAVNKAAPIFKNCIVERNISYYSPILIENGSNPVFQNLLAVHNSGPQLMQIDSSTVSLVNSTISCNFLNDILIRATRQSQVNVSNSISFYNPVYSASWQYTTYDSAEVRLDASSASFKYSITQVYNQGTNLLAGYHPKFKDTATVTGPDGLYFTTDDGFNVINPCSPAINAGSNALAAGVTTDIIGNPRSYEGVADLGAYEMQQNKSAIPTVMYVNAAATSGLNNGTSWANAFTDLHQALRTCSDTIKMATGNYAPFTSATRQAYWLDNKRIILGAYPATGNPTNANRNYSLYPTNITGTTTTAIKAGMVVRAINLDSTAVMDGITFTGIGDPNTFLKLGGVYYLNCNNPVISNCTFTANNDLVFWGNGNRNVVIRNCDFSANNIVYSSWALDLLSIQNSSGTLFRNCTFQNNKTVASTSIVGEYGKIFNIQSSSPAFDSCTFLLNRATMLTNTNSNTTVSNTLFLNNYSAYYPTDIINYNSNPVVSNCIFKDSALGYPTSSFGGIMFNRFSNPVITNCRFTNGRAGAGGAVYNDSSLAKFTKCVFSDCQSALYNINSSNIVLNNCIGTGTSGSFITNKRSKPVLYNCTVVNGYSGTLGVMNNDNTSFPEIYNSVFWKNYQGQAIDTSYLNNRRDIMNVLNGQVTIRNSMFEFFDAGVSNGNISKTDPRFMDYTNPIGADSIWFSADDGLRLCNCSPAINSGNNTYMVSATDISDMPRPFGTTVDRGAYELQATPPSGLSNVVYVHAGATGNNSGEDWNNAYSGLQPAIMNACADTIKIAAGIYKPALQNRDSLFKITRGMTLLGSYNPANPNAPREVDVNPTILSGDIGIVNDTTDNSRGLMSAYYIDTLQIDGLVFRDINRSNSTGTNYPLALGAQYVQNLDISNSRFYNNFSNSGNGTLYLYLVKKINIRKTVFSQNKASWGAGIMLAGNGYSKKITDCIFDRNESTGQGGAIYCTESGAAFVNCLFNGNIAQIGGGMYLSNNPDMQVTNCTFSNNKNTSYQFSGAGIHSAGASWQGGGAGPNIENCIFTTNSQVGSNNQSCYMDIYYNKNGYPPSNCRVEIRIHHSAVSTQSEYYGLGNVNPYSIVYKNPADAIGPDKRWFTADDGLQLSICSEGIDKGQNLSNTSATDLGGKARIFNGIIDIGAYEFSGGPELIKLLTTANDSLVANKEVTDVDGWTHYYKDCFYLMSVKKTGQNIGTVGDGIFSVKIKTLPAYSSGTPLNLSAATYINPGVSWKVMNRYWKINTAAQLTDSIQVRFPYTATDFNDVKEANPAIITPQQLVFYKTDGAATPTDLTITATNFNKYLHAFNPSATKWTFTALDTSTYLASYFVKNLNGGGGGGIMDIVCTSNTSTWLGITADWNQATNWSTGQVPTVCTHVIVTPGVPFMPEVTIPNAACYWLTLNTGATITIRTGANLSIVGQ